VVSVTTYRDAGFVPHAYVNFLCLLGWNPKDNREQMSRAELVEAFKLEGVNRSNAVVNFTEEDPIDPKALWLNGQTIRTMAVDEVASLLLPYVQAAGWAVNEAKMRAVTPLIQERIRVLPDVTTVADLFFVDQLPPYDPAELIPQKGDAAMADRVLAKASEVLAGAEFTHAGLESSLREAANQLGVKAGQMFLPIRVAVCGRKTAPPLFETLEVLGRETSLKRIGQAREYVKRIAVA
jgi:glutamyl-tRNA synthetase